MQKHQLYINLFTITSALALAACADEVDGVVTPDVPEVEVGEKTPIELTVGGVEGVESSVTRANVDNPTDNPYQAKAIFDENLPTKVFMLMMSEYGTQDYSGAKTTKYTVSRGDVAANSSAISFDAKNTKYWEDAHGRSSRLSIYAFAQKVTTINSSWNSCTFQKSNGNGGFADAQFDTSNSNPWQIAEVYPFIASWGTTNATDNSQNQNTVVFQDLLYSNNLADYSNSTSLSDAQKTDRRLQFNFETRKFPTSNVMNFYHAMSKITINIVEGAGFNSSSNDDFKFATGTNVKLQNFNTKGLFSIKYGVFQQITAHADIPSIYLKSSTATGAQQYVLEALAVPNNQEFLRLQSESANDPYSRFVSGSNDVMMEFTIDNSTYKITSGALYTALLGKEGARGKTDNGTYIPLDAGKNYVFTFNVGKTQVNNITAKVAEWETVTAETVSPSNAKVTLSLDARGDAQNSGVNFYQSIHQESAIPADPNTILAYDWDKGYTKSESATYKDDDHWETEWYWADNKSFHHFRALMPTTTNAVATLYTESDKQYVSITSSGATSAGYDNVAWGAPFKDKSTSQLYYNTTKGFDAISKDDTSTGNDESKHQIYKAIGATKEQVKILMFHVMSGVHFTIKTTDDNAKVTLYNSEATNKRPKVQLVGYYPNGKVWMGTGLVNETGTVTTTSVAGIACSTTTTGANDDQEYYYNAIPQDLAGIKLYITTPDDNLYVVDMKDLVASSTNITSNNIVNPYEVIPEGETNAGKFSINRWYPGFKYNYTIKLKKTGIESITATIVDWENIEADDETVQIQ